MRDKKSLFTACILAMSVSLAGCGTTYNRGSGKYEYNPACSMDPGSNSDPTCTRAPELGTGDRDLKTDIFKPAKPNKS